MPIKRWIWSSFAAGLLFGAFGLGIGVLKKAQSIAHELVDPPFYHPQPLTKVNATFASLAKGDGDDPGGTWTVREVNGLQVWHLQRRQRARGVVVLLHGFGDDRWGTSPALRSFPNLDAVIFTYLRRDDAKRAGGWMPPVTFGAKESLNVVEVVHDLEDQGIPRQNILLMGRSLGASVGLLALAKLEREGRGPLAGIIWEGAPASSSDFAERLVRGTEDHYWHPLLAPPIGWLAGRWAAHLGQYHPSETDLLEQVGSQRFKTPALCFLATQDRLASPPVQRAVLQRFDHAEIIEVPTWHLHCAEVLGPRYGKAIQEASERWLPSMPK